MMTQIIIGVVIALISGVAAYLLTTKATEKKRRNILKNAEIDGEMIKKEKILQAKEKFIQLKAEHDRSCNERNAKISQAESKLKQQRLA